MSNAMKSHRRSTKLMRLVAITSLGTVFAQSCGGRVQDSVSNGFSLFLTQSTVTILNSVFGFESNGTDGGDNGNGDPFDPPVQP